MKNTPIMLYRISFREAYAILPYYTSFLGLCQAFHHALLTKKREKGIIKERNTAKGDGK
jgi:hypothetical protein